MISKIVRAAMLCAVTACLAMASGCCGICGGACQVYQHPNPSCVGMRYLGCCTCEDDCRDTVNQITDILLP
jgi:hypothetical protein